MNSQNSSLTINISNTSKFKSGHVMLNFGRNTGKAYFTNGFRFVNLSIDFREAEILPDC